MLWCNDALRSVGACQTNVGVASQLLACTCWLGPC